METNKTLKGLGFKVLGNIGEGAYGQVRLAKSKRYNKLVAIKVMNRKKGSSEFTSKYLPRELEILRKVRHPHIVELHEIVELPSGEVYIVMEAAAMSLRQKIMELHHIPTQQAKIWFSQLLSAVSYLHQQDIVHRDLKCSNILLSSDNQIKLTDFGFGRYSRGFPDLSRTFCCTLSYAAPEVIHTEPYDPKKSDVWSLGVVLYIMVFGSRPFPAMLPHTQVQPLRFPERTAVEESCKSLISYMLEYNPSARPSVAEVEQHPWLGPSQESEMSETAVSPLAEAESAPQDDQEWSDLPKFSSLLSAVLNTCGQIDVQILEKKSRVIERSAVEDDKDVEDERRRSEGDVTKLQESERSRAGASPCCSSIESVGEEPGCFRWSSVSAAIKRAAKTYVTAPVLRASRSLRGGMRRIFRTNTQVQISSTAAASIEAPASSPEKRPEDGTEAAEQKSTVRERTRRLRFSKWKVLKKI